MEALLDPTALIGMATLVLIEVVLGIDNLVFIAILSNKLPPEQRQRARVTGLVLALAMRIVLLFTISSLATLTAPLFTVWGQPLSGRDIIHLLGGLFLIFKATIELHEKLEGVRKKNMGPIKYAGYWQVVIQIVILDAVFSLDAVITAVGMANSLPVMVTAVCIAMLLMIIASNRLMNFISSFPTVIVLCLGFLLMIGFSLVLEGLGYHVPKGYLYAAIGFSVLVEACNQMIQANRNKTYAALDPRARVTDAVLSLLGGRPENETIQEGVASVAPKEHELSAFRPQERQMIQRVLRLSDLSVQAVMTHRHDVYWIDVTDPIDVIRNDIRECAYSRIMVCEGGDIDHPIGVLDKKQLADYLLENPGATDFREIVRQPLTLPDTLTMLPAMETLRKERQHTAFIVDDHNIFKGMITLTDLVEAIVGDLPEGPMSREFTYHAEEDGSYILSGAMPVSDIREFIHQLPLPEGDYNTVAGIFLTVNRKLPKAGETINLGDWQLRIEEMHKRRITKVRFTKVGGNWPEGSAAS